MTFAKKIEKLLFELGITQKRLAKMLGVSQASIACWKTGVTEARIERRAKLEKLCEKKGIKINWRT